MIELHNITFSHPGTPPLFLDFSWRVPLGERWTVVGPSGCGKTTLLMLMSGLLPSARGHVCIGGEILSAPSPENGLVFQDCALLPWSTIRQNIELGLRVSLFQGAGHDKHGPLNRQTLKARTTEWLDRLGLTAVADRFPSQVSGGQRQRAAIGRTMVMHAKRLLMDEPFSAVDAPTRKTLREDTLALCSDRGLSLVLVTHSIEEAVLLGQKILVLSHTNPVRAEIVDNAHAQGELSMDSAEWTRRCDGIRGRLE